MVFLVGFFLIFGVVFLVFGVVVVVGFCFDLVLVWLWGLGFFWLCFGVFFCFLLCFGSWLVLGFGFFGHFLGFYVFCFVLVLVLFWGLGVFWSFLGFFCFLFWFGSWLILGFGFFGGF